jgi:hypothetical protein
MTTTGEQLEALATLIDTGAVNGEVPEALVRLSSGLCEVAEGGTGPISSYVCAGTSALGGDGTGPVVGRVRRGVTANHCVFGGAVVEKGYTPGMNELEIDAVDECSEVVLGLEEADVCAAERNGDRVHLTAVAVRVDGRVVASLHVAEGSASEVLLDVWVFGTLISHPPLRLLDSIVSFSVSLMWVLAWYSLNVFFGVLYRRVRVCEVLFLIPLLRSRFPVFESVAEYVSLTFR